MNKNMFFLVKKSSQELIFFGLAIHLASHHLRIIYQKNRLEFPAVANRGFIQFYNCLWKTRILNE